MKGRTDCNRTIAITTRDSFRLNWGTLKTSARVALLPALKAVRVMLRGKTEKMGFKMMHVFFGLGSV